MALGISSYAFRWAVGTCDFTPAVPLRPLGLLEKAAESGAEVVQICDNVALDDLPKEMLTSLARRADELDLVLEVGIRGSRPEQLNRNLEVTKLLGSKLLRVVLADVGWEPSLGECMAVFKSFLPELRTAGVTLAIENHFHLAPVELVRLIEAIGEPMVGVCLDPVNSISKLFCPKETISLLAPFAVSVHAKDAIIRRWNTGFYITGCPLGQGLIDLPEMLDTIRNSGRNPNILLESWMDRLDDEAATLAQEQAWICQGIAYLRRLL